jgi:hypothetical protein
VKGQVPAYAEEVCRCGHGEPPMWAHGRYRGMCEVGKTEAVEASRAKRSNGNGHFDDGMTAEIRELQANRPPQLSRTVKDLVKHAERLEKAIAHRQVARRQAQAALAEFKEGLQLVGRVAQSLVNQQLPSQERDAA